MTKNIFIATAEPYSGKSIVALGLVNMLLGKTQKVGYFKPIVSYDPSESKDDHIQTVIEHFGIPMGYEDAYVLTRQEALRKFESEAEGQVIESVIEKYKKLEENFDFIVVEGSDFVGEGAAFEFDANVDIAKNLGSPAIIVVPAEGKSTAQIVNSALAMLRNFEAREVQVLGIVVNKVSAEQGTDVKALLSEQLSDNVILSVIPADKGLLNPTMKEILDGLGGNLLFGKEQLSNQVDNFVTGAMNLPNFLNHIKDNVLIVTPGDRGDIIIGSLQANISSNYPKVAGIVLSAGSVPEEPVVRLIEGSETIVPIISVNSGTFQTITGVAGIRSRITPDNHTKIRLAIDTFDKCVDVQALEQKIATFKSEGITPHMFQYQLTKWAKNDVKHIVLPEGQDDRILKAASRLSAQGIVKLTILGDPAAVAASAKRLGIEFDPASVQVLNPSTAENFDDYVNTFYELRKSKGVNLEMAKDVMSDVSYFGTMMVYKGHADGMVSGAVNTTAHTIRPALQFVKTKPGTSVVSSVFFMCLPDRVAVFGDCAVNPNPTAEQLAEIAISSAESSILFGIEPRIAMLSYSSGTSGEGADVEKVRRATEIVKEKRPDLKIEGPIQYDAAVDPSVGKQKLPNSEVAGQASVLVFPDLNTGNNTYKAVQRETGALAIGPMLQGLNKPVNDLSRGCTVDDIFNTVIITAIQSQKN